MSGIPFCKFRNLIEVQQDLENLKGSSTWAKIWKMDQAAQKITDSIATVDEATKTFSVCLFEL